MNIFGMGPAEIFVILVVALLIFGPRKLPEIGRSMGKAIRGFQEASKEFQAELKKETDQLESGGKSDATAKSEKIAAASDESTPSSSGQS